jgi:beta-phosphoglucomutase family hydrolase
LGATVEACLFDLDGVLTRTAITHEAAWTSMFDDFLCRETGSGAKPFTSADYEQFVDGKARADGIRSFLESRGITLPDGDPDDAPGTSTVQGLAKEKNDRFLAELAANGVGIYDGSIAFVRAARLSGLRTAVVSSSANAAQVLEAAHIDALFDARVDGVTARTQQLRGKPAPDTFLAGAAAVGVAPGHAAVFEDALAGVEAGHAGKFALVVGVDRVGHRDALLAHGADVVVADLSELVCEP